MCNGYTVTFNLLIHSQAQTSAPAAQACNSFLVVSVDSNQFYQNKISMLNMQIRLNWRKNLNKLLEIHHEKKNKNK